MQDFPRPLVEEGSVLTLPLKEYKGYRIPFRLYMKITTLQEQVAREKDNAKYFKSLYDAQQTFRWQPETEQQTMMSRFKRLAPELYALALLGGGDA